MKQFKIVVEKHPDIYVAYPLGLKGVVVGQGDTYETALADVTSAIHFHLETFGPETLEIDPPNSRGLHCRGQGLTLMSKFPVDAPIRGVIRAFEQLGFKLVREGHHISMLRENKDGTKTPLTMPNHRTLKSPLALPSVLPAACSGPDTVRPLQNPHCQPPSGSI